MIIREKQVVAVGQATADFDSFGWTTIDLSTIPANMTSQQCGSDIASIMIENKFASSASAYVVFHNSTAGSVATDGWEIEPGAVFGEGQVKNMRYVSVRSTANTGTVKILLRSYKTATNAPWS